MSILFFYSFFIIILQNAYYAKMAPTLMRMPNQTFKFVQSSKVRLKVLGFLSRQPATPTELASKTEKHLSHISRTLKELESRDLVLCSNPDLYRERKYALTSQGTQVVDQIRRYEIRMSLR